MNGRSLRIWALLGAHRGDNNQILALAESLGLPFEIKQLSYNAARHLYPRLLGATLRSLTPKARRLVTSEEPPDLTISCGHRSVPVVQALRLRSGGRTRSVHIGYPRLSPSRFDLVVTTPEYPVPDHPNVLRIPFALSSATRPAPNKADRARVKGYARPCRLVVLGGPTLFWTLPTKDVVAAIQFLVEQAREDGGSVIAVGSPRTPAALLDAVRRVLDQADVPALLAPTAGPPSYASLLAEADAIFVTSDSVSMISDAILSKKPVGLIPIRSSRLGRLLLGIVGRDGRLRPRDLRFFWAGLAEQGLVGTLEEPRAGKVPDLGALVATRVRSLLNS